MAASFQVYVAAEDGLYRSTDGGQSWAPHGPRGITAEAVAANTRGDVYVSGAELGRTMGLFVLRAGESQWRKTDLTGASNNGNRAVAQLADDLLVVGTGAAGLWLVTDGGRKTMPIGPGVLVRRGLLGAKWEPDINRSRSVYGVAVLGTPTGDHRSSVTLCCVAAMHAWVVEWSRMDGTWHPSSPLPNPAVERLCGLGTELVVIAEGGAVSSRDVTDAGSTWRPFGPRLDYGGRIHGACVAPDGRLWCVGEGTLFVSSRDGDFPSSDDRRWTAVWSTGDSPRWARALKGGGVAPPVFSPNYDSDGVMLAVSAQSGIIRSDDGGATWAPANDGLRAAINSFALAIVRPLHESVVTSDLVGQAASPAPSSISRLKQWEAKNGGRVEVRQSASGWIATATTYTFPWEVGNPKYERMRYEEWGPDPDTAASGLLRQLGGRW